MCTPFIARTGYVEGTFKIIDLPPAKSQNGGDFKSPKFGNFNLYESLEGVDIFFTDTSNTTFYVTDENIEAFLDALSEWHAKAKNEAWACRLRRSIKEAQEKIKTCEEQLKELGK